MSGVVSLRPVRSCRMRRGDQDEMSERSETRTNRADVRERRRGMMRIFRLGLGPETGLVNIESNRNSYFPVSRSSSPELNEAVIFSINEQTSFIFPSDEMSSQDPQALWRLRESTVARMLARSLCPGMHHRLRMSAWAPQHSPALHTEFARHSLPKQVRRKTPMRSQLSVVVL